MCATDFYYILFGDDKMVLCKQADFNLKRVKKAIKKIFPGIRRKELKAAKKESCRKMFPSQFDCQVGPQEKNNDWGKHPFLVLWLIKKRGIIYCAAEAA